MTPTPSFGTRGSQVQILPLRPLFQITNCLRGTLWGTKHTFHHHIAQHLCPKDFRIPRRLIRDEPHQAGGHHRFRAIGECGREHGENGTPANVLSSKAAPEFGSQPLPPLPPDIPKKSARIVDRDARQEAWRLLSRPWSRIHLECDRLGV
jgi:hypothetical protein